MTIEQMTFLITCAAALGTLFVFVLVKISTVNRKLDRLDLKMDLSVVARLDQVEKSNNELSKWKHRLNNRTQKQELKIVLLAEKVGIEFPPEVKTQ